MRASDNLIGRALVANTSHLRSLGQVLRACDQNQTMRDTCSTSEYFWKETLKRFFGPALVEQRGDLVGGQAWEEFASNLATAVVYKYSILEDRVNGDVSPPEPYYEFVEIDEEDRDLDRYILNIPAQLPLPGTKGHVYIGYYVRYTHLDHLADFFLHPDQNESLDGCIGLLTDKIISAAHEYKQYSDYELRLFAHGIKIYYDPDDDKSADLIDDGTQVQQLDREELYNNITSKPLHGDVLPVYIIVTTGRLDGVSDRLTLEFNMTIRPITF